MPLFIIERQFAEQIEATPGLVDEIERVNADEGVRWVFSFLSSDKKKTYCLYEAPTAESIVSAAKAAGLPSDVVVEVEEVRRPEALPI